MSTNYSGLLKNRDWKTKPHRVLLDFQAKNTYFGGWGGKHIDLWGQDCGVKDPTLYLTQVRRSSFIESYLWLLKSIFIGDKVIAQQ